MAKTPTSTEPWACAPYDAPSTSVEPARAPPREARPPAFRQKVQLPRRNPQIENLLPRIKVSSLKIRLPSQKCFLTRKADDEAFADEQELQDFLSLLMRHWNRVGRKLEEDDVFTPLLFEDEKGEVLRLCSRVEDRGG